MYIEIVQSYARGLIRQLTSGETTHETQEAIDEINQIFTVSGYNNRNFPKVVKLLTDIIEDDITNGAFECPINHTHHTRRCASEIATDRVRVLIELLHERD